MTGIKIYNYIRSQTKTNPSTYSDQKLLDDFNMNKDLICEEIAKINEDIFGMLAYRNLVAGQREYSLPEYMLSNIKYFEVCLEVLPDGSFKYTHSNEMDLVSYGGSTNESQIQKEFQFRRPGFDLFRNSLWLYTAKAIEAVFDGLKLWYIRYPDDVTLAQMMSNMDLSNDLVHPISAGVVRQFHKIIADMTVITYKNSKEKPIPLTVGEQGIAVETQKKLAAISGMNLDRNQQATVPTYAYGQNY